MQPQACTAPRAICRLDAMLKYRRARRALSIAAAGRAAGVRRLPGAAPSPAGSARPPRIRRPPPIRPRPRPRRFAELRFALLQKSRQREATSLSRNAHLALGQTAALCDPAVEAATPRLRPPGIHVTLTAMAPDGRA